MIISKYVDLENRFAIYGENGYYINPFLVRVAALDELNLSMSYSQLIDYIKKIGDEKLQKLKTKCLSLFEIIDNIGNINSNKLDSKELEKIKDSKIKINSNGDIYYKDAEKLLKTIIDKVNELYIESNRHINKQTQNVEEISNKVKLLAKSWKSNYYDDEDI